jgi:hypothetical protein
MTIRIAVPTQADARPTTLLWPSMLHCGAQTEWAAHIAAVEGMPFVDLNEMSD